MTQAEEGPPEVPRPRLGDTLRRVPEVSVVVPVYREEESIPVLVEQLIRHLEECRASYEILLIDDGSPQGATWQTIGDVARRYPQVRGLRLSRNFGKEAALCAGLEHASGRAVITMDGDLQHPAPCHPRDDPPLAVWRGGDRRRR
jgi:glycosyltransferase involved in cell wall biosynthesis